jgi:DnaK suppressor protein
MEVFELERFKRILQSTLADMSVLVRKRDEIAVENTPDTIDYVQRAADRELAIRQIESSFKMLQSVKFALERITDGTYGTCLNCEDEISRKRLEAVPWAAYCVQCQDLADKERVLPRSEGPGLLTHMRMRDVA